MELYRIRNFTINIVLVSIWLFIDHNYFVICWPEFSAKIMDFVTFKKNCKLKFNKIAFSKFTRPKFWENARKWRNYSVFADQITSLDRKWLNFQPFYSWLIFPNWLILVKNRSIIIKSRKKCLFRTFLI